MFFFFFEETDMDALILLDNLLKILAFSEVTLFVLKF